MLESTRTRCSSMAGQAGLFSVDQRCVRASVTLFKSVMETVCKSVRQTADLSFLSYGERCYGKTLVALCAETLQTKQRGRPANVLPKGVRVRVKNKGDQKHKRGRKRAK